MKKFFREFKTFAMRGNVMDMAVGIILGGAFGKIVSSLVGDLIMPLIGLFIGGVNFTDLKITLKDAATDSLGNAVPAVSINYGMFLQTTFDFIVIAFCIFLMIKTINRLTHKKEEVSTTPPEPSDEVKLLSEIRDLLQQSKKRNE
jgi:large conductance mechanosensitive channel